ncbi:VOC family protein [Streptomyces sulfonofaciens]|nr:VOC family protein [Streptomyces sulfonofaciens]
MSHVEIGVRDLTRSQEFYGGLLGFTPVPAESGGDTLVMQAGEARVRLVEAGPGGTPSGWVDDDLQRGFRHFGLKVDEVDARVARLAEAGVEIRVQPLDAFGGVRLAFFADPDGAHLEFVSGPLQYQPLWSPELAAEEEASLVGGWDGEPRFDHVAVTVADLDQALAYYRDTLGIPVVGQLDRRDQDERGFVITYFRAGRTVIEVFSFDAGTAPNPWQPEPDLLGIRAIGIDVADPDTTRAALTAAGGEPVAWRGDGRGADLVADRDRVVANLVRAGNR